jgi:hypothetical protein
MGSPHHPLIFGRPQKDRQMESPQSAVPLKTTGPTRWLNSRALTRLESVVMRMGIIIIGSHRVHFRLLVGAVLPLASSLRGGDNFFARLRLGAFDCFRVRFGLPAGLFAWALSVSFSMLIVMLVSPCRFGSSDSSLWSGKHASQISAIIECVVLSGNLIGEWFLFNKTRGGVIWSLNFFERNGDTAHIGPFRDNRAHLDERCW